MPDDDLMVENETLRSRLKQLGAEKATLHLVLRLIERLNPLLSIESLLSEVLTSIVDTIGGTDIKLYYWDGPELHQFDLSGTDLIIQDFDDPLARQVADRREVVERQEEKAAAALLHEAAGRGYSWGFPLLVGEELIGIITIENTHGSSKMLGTHLRVFFDHAALVLSNELRRIERVRSQEALREKTEELDAYFNTALDLFTIADVSGRFRKVNPAWETMLGYSCAELEGALFLDFVHPDDLQPTLDAMTTLAKQQPVINFVNRYRCKDGSYRWIEWRSAARGDTIHAAARDITERKQAEESLRRWGHIFEHAQWGIAVGHPDGKSLLVVNPAFARERGYTVAETLGLTVPEIYAAEVRAEVPSYVRTADERGHVTFESRHVRKDGSVFPVWVDVTSVKDEQGDVLYRVVNVQDISERKQTEAELEKHRHHLEELVDVRTAELAQARDIAEAANRAKSVFLSNMSHELRTPLNAILGFSQIMAVDPSVSPDQKEHLGIIAQSGEHLLDLINNVLDLSKIESGRIEFEPKECDLGFLIDELMSMLRVRAEAKGIQLLFDQSSSFPRFITTDTVKLRQVLINLIGNAIKFTEEGRVTLKVSVLALNHGGENGKLLFEVSDTGPGIAPEDLPQIFDAFYQSNAPRGREGSGLGLAITREYVKLMDGSISADSTLGEGSTFWFSMAYSPVAREHIPDLHATDVRVESIENAASFRVLIVEDQFENRLLLKALLEPFGFQIREALDGRDALTITQEWLPHLILMDRRMPVMDGLTATRRIRELALEVRPAIIAVTAHAYSEERQEMLDAGCNGFVRKPFRDRDLFDVLAAHLDVHVQYVALSAPTSKEGGGRSLAPESLGGLPDDLRGDLEAALTSLDMAAVEDSVARIWAEDPTLAAQVKQKADMLAYGDILAALRLAAKAGGTREGEEE